MRKSGENASGTSKAQPDRGNGLDTNVQFVKGVGERVGKTLGKLGIFTARDLLTHYPHRHEDRTQFRRISQLKQGETATIRGKVVASESGRTPRSQMLLTKVVISDGSGTASDP